MSKDQYSYNWDSYSDHLRDMLHNMLKSEELTDVTLVCDDNKQFRAHKIVLSACSSVFKNIINFLPQNNPVIYLRGIKHQEVESILDFMYLGVTTFYQVRINDFLDVAKNLGIKEIGKDLQLHDKILKNEESVIPQIIEVTSEDIRTSTEIVKLQNEAVLVSCEQCDSKFTSNGTLNRHVQTKHEGLKFDCDQCSQQYTDKADLKKHRLSKHDGVKYACIKCDEQFTLKRALKNHMLSIHEGVKYDCDQCDEKFTRRVNVRLHKENIHQDIKYDCSYCHYKAPLIANLRKHIKLVHGNSFE